MVALLADQDARTDAVFRALGDRTRRDILARVQREGASVTTLATAYDMSFAAVQKHVAVLERAHLVRKQRLGREQVVRADVATLRQAVDLLVSLEGVWRERADRLSAILSEGDPR
jgi:DNA-binding transcriptional ArsR family regulator